MQIRFPAWALLVVPVMVMNHAQAGNIELYPTRIVLTQKSPTVAIMVRNTGGQATVIQTEVMRWTSTDAYAPSRELLVNPPIVALDANGLQIIRVGLNHPIDSDHEVAYRVFLQEVPQPLSRRFGGLQVALRLGVPVFIPAHQPDMRIQWKALRTKEGNIRINLKNFGNTHVQVLDIAISTPNNKAVFIARKAVRDYVLADQEGSWTLRIKTPWKGSSISLLAHTDQGEMTSENIEIAHN